jgi:hypothetical protein
LGQAVDIKLQADFLAFAGTYAVSGTGNPIALQMDDGS